MLGHDHEITSFLRENYVILRDRRESQNLDHAVSHQHWVLRLRSFLASRRMTEEVAEEEEFSALLDNGGLSH